MKSFLEKTEFTLDDIQSLIDNKAEEGIYLEFKGAEAFIPTAEKDEIYRKREIGKDISAFANSDGGTIIYGLAEKSGRAKRITWIDSQKYSKGWLQQVIESNTSRPVSLIEIHPLSNPSDPNQQIYVVKIQQSPYAPHMAKGGTFHRRNNHGNADMAEYEIREMYYRTGRTDLEIINLPKYDLPDLPNFNGIGFRPSIQHTFNFQVKNSGNSIEHYWKLEIHISTGLLMSQPRTDNINHFVQRHENGRGIFLIANKAPIFQNEINTVTTIDIKFDKNSYHYYDTEKILLKLYYSNGIKEKEFLLKELLTYKSLPIPKDLL